jgi:hypothetical protein
VASYLHGTSRSLDPHPHNIVANAVVDDAGEVRTLDARGLYLNASAPAAFRWESRGLGLGWWQRSNGTWEIAGVDQGAIDEFSSRHAEIDEVRKALEVRLGREVTPEDRNQVALATRSAKRPVLLVRGNTYRTLTPGRPYGHGRTNAAAAADLSLSAQTIEAHLRGSLGGSRSVTGCSSRRSWRTRREEPGQ